MDTFVRQWIVDILVQHPSLLAVAVRQRAKFEGWLKFELAAYAELQGATSVQVETPSVDSTLGLSRSDLTFFLDGKRYDVELKTPNSNWRIPGVLDSTRPITQNIAEIVIDGRKLRGCGGQGIVAFVLFPVIANDKRWVAYLNRIAYELNLPLTEVDHSSRLMVPLGEGHTADVIVCCFTITTEANVPVVSRAFMSEN